MPSPVLTNWVFLPFPITEHKPMFYTVYGSFESKPNGRDYIGKHSTHDPYDDYRGSYTDESFDPDSKIVLGYANTPEAAIWLEMQYQRAFRVAENPQFANRAYQTSTGFTKEGIPLSEETKRKIGGANSNPSEETRQKLRDFRTGKKSSEETKLKQKEALSGENNPMFGRSHTEDTRQKMKESRARRPPISEETRQKMRESHLGKTRSEGSRQKDREAKLGEKNPLFGKKLYVNVSGETKFQSESPGEEWQLGRKWKK
jgi:hypothetical protein